LALKKPGLSDDEAARLRHVAALNSNDLTTLLRLTDPDGRRFASFYPQDGRPETPSTDSAIDTFLSTYGKSTPHEDALLERLIFNPVPDYSQVLAKEAELHPKDDNAPVSAQDAMLDAFLAGQKSKTEQERTRQAARVAETPVAPTPPDPDTSLNESLAKIYIKNRRFDKAYEIIYQLSLNFPEKSIYFADQLRYLRKLIRLQELSKR
ncbi:MAG: hypothetical protein K2M94_00765, partial [Paramuribaculum sp.]|nr:hypothetical protein [Paramuribaculum sp.]